MITANFCFNLNPSIITLSKLPLRVCTFAVLVICDSMTEIGFINELKTTHYEFQKI
jgi:hypothetical protein